MYCLWMSGSKWGRGKRWPYNGQLSITILNLHMQETLDNGFQEARMTCMVQSYHLLFLHIQVLINSSR